MLTKWVNLPATFKDISVWGDRMNPIPFAVSNIRFTTQLVSVTNTGLVEITHGLDSRQTWVQVYEYLYLSTLEYRFESTYLSTLSISAGVLVLGKFISTCTLLKYFEMYLAPCLIHGLSWKQFLNNNPSISHLLGNTIIKLQLLAQLFLTSYKGCMCTN